MTRTKSRGLYRCKECSKEFQSDFALFQHLQSRTKRCTNTACFYCGDDENSPMFRLSDHMKERHSVFECAFCREKFFLRAKFEEHMNNREGIVNAWSGDTLPGMGERESFDELIDRLNPDTVVYEECERIKEKLEWFMRHNTSYKQCHITMAGSIAKETPLSKADVDLILFLHEYSTLEEFINSKNEIIERIKRHVENRDMNWAHGLRFQRRTPYSIQFELSVSGSSTLMDVDLLPAVQLLPRNTYSERDALYTKMKSMSVMEKKHCGPCLSELQVQFVRRVPDTLKQVIRIVKNWIKIVREEERCRTVRCYFCELVVIDYWLSDDSPHHEIDIEDYVRQVLYRLCFCQSLRIVWPDEYDFLKYRDEEDQPMVLDPANPFVNVAPNMKDASRVSERAVEMFERYDTVKHRPLPPKQYAFPNLAFIESPGVTIPNLAHIESPGVTFPNLAHIESPAATLQRPADMRIEMGSSGFNDDSAGCVVLQSKKIPVGSSKLALHQPENSSCSRRCKCVAVLVLTLVAIVLGVIIWKTTSV